MVMLVRLWLITTFIIWNNKNEVNSVTLNKAKPSMIKPRNNEPNLNAAKIVCIKNCSPQQSCPYDCAYRTPSGELVSSLPQDYEKYLKNTSGLNTVSIVYDNKHLVGSTVSSSQAPSSSTQNVLKALEKELLAAIFNDPQSTSVTSISNSGLTTDQPSALANLNQFTKKLGKYLNIITELLRSSTKKNLSLADLTQSKEMQQVIKDFIFFISSTSNTNNEAKKPSQAKPNFTDGAALKFMTSTPQQKMHRSTTTKKPSMILQTHKTHGTEKPYKKFSPKNMSIWSIFVSLIEETLNQSIDTKIQALTTARPNRESNKPHLRPKTPLLLSKPAQPQPKERDYIMTELKKAITSSFKKSPKRKRPGKKPHRDPSIKNSPVKQAVPHLRKPPAMNNHVIKPPHQLLTFIKNSNREVKKPLKKTITQPTRPPSSTTSAYNSLKRLPKRKKPHASHIKPALKKILSTLKPLKKPSHRVVKPVKPIKPLLPKPPSSPTPVQSPHKGLPNRKNPYIDHIKPALKKIPSKPKPHEKLNHSAATKPLKNPLLLPQRPLLSSTLAYNPHKGLPKKEENYSFLQGIEKVLNSQNKPVIKKIPPKPKPLKSPSPGRVTKPLKKTQQLQLRPPSSTTPSYNQPNGLPKRKEHNAFLQGLGKVLNSQIKPATKKIPLTSKPLQKLSLERVTKPFIKAQALPQRPPSSTTSGHNSPNGLHKRKEDNTLLQGLGKVLSNQIKPSIKKIPPKLKTLKNPSHSGVSKPLKQAEPLHPKPSSSTTPAYNPPRGLSKRQKHHPMLQELEKVLNGQIKPSLKKIPSKLKLLKVPSHGQATKHLKQAKPSLILPTIPPYSPPKGLLLRKELYSLLQKLEKLLNSHIKPALKKITPKPKPLKDHIKPHVSPVPNVKKIKKRPARPKDLKTPQLSPTKAIKPLSRIKTTIKPHTALKKLPARRPVPKPPSPEAVFTLLKSLLSRILLMYRNSTDQQSVLQEYKTLKPKLRKPMPSIKPPKKPRAPTPVNSKPTLTKNNYPNKFLDQTSDSNDEKNKSKKLTNVKLLRAIIESGMLCKLTKDKRTSSVGDLQLGPANG